MQDGGVPEQAADRDREELRQAAVPALGVLAERPEVVEEEAGRRGQHERDRGGADDVRGPERVRPRQPEIDAEVEHRIEGADDGELQELRREPLARLDETVDDEFDDRVHGHSAMTAETPPRNEASNGM